MAPFRPLGDLPKGTALERLPTASARSQVPWLDAMAGRARSESPLDFEDFASRPPPFQGLVLMAKISWFQTLQRAALHQVLGKAYGLGTVRGPLQCFWAAFVAWVLFSL